MKLSVCITLNDRPLPVLDAVFSSLKDQGHDELVIVLDRSPGFLADYVHKAWYGDGRVKFVDIQGEPGWRSPVKAWNRGYEAVTGDVLYCFSSETVQAAGNVLRMRQAMERYPESVVFGRAECSCGPMGQEVNWGNTAPGNLLCDAAHPRPLGFIWAAPMANVRQIGGWDEEYDKGLWYDETDFFLRLWRSGLDFVFDDSIFGTHLHHERPVLATVEGQEATQRNLAYTLKKHGTTNPWPNRVMAIERQLGWTRWKHI